MKTTHDLSNSSVKIMKIPYSWLKEITGVQWSPEEMEDRLTRSGTAGFVNKHNPEHFKNVVTARITKLEKHPNADKLQVAEVDTGDTTFTVICGAPNAAKGQIVALATPGANLKGEFEIKEIKMRGVISSGMICAEDELGLSDDHDGIIVFDDNTPINVPVFEVLGLDDAIIDFEITPNRPDCLCVDGIARELSVLADKEIDLIKTAPVESSEKASDYIKVTIEDPESCPRYSARIIKNVTISPSPEWLQRRLKDCGVRPINNIVDIGNYVMLEMNQPLHAFDYDRFGSKEVVVRRAKDGEEFSTLDHEKRRLDGDILMITNGKEPVAVAGVMGGLSSEVESDTTTILLESAYFDSSVIRKSRNKIGLSTEASFRFERGIDPNGTATAADRAAALIAELAGGEVFAGVVDAYPKAIEPVTVVLRPERVNKILGTDISDEYMKKTLSGLGMDLEDGDILNVTVPTYRPDITREVDLIEEIARLYGLDNIENTKTNKGPLYSPIHRRDTIKTDLRDLLTGFGFEEIQGTGFAKPKKMLRLEPDIEPIKINNPISDDFAYMRTRILYSLLIATSHNIRHRNIDLCLFELGKVFLRTDKFPDEPEFCGLIMSGTTGATYWKEAYGEADLFELKGILDGISDSLGLSHLNITPAKLSGYDNSCSYTISSGKYDIGVVGRVDRKIARLFDLKQDCYAAELKVGKLIEAHRGIIPFKPLPKFPASNRDVAIIVDMQVSAGSIRKSIAEWGGELIESVEIFDLFTGGNIEEDKKSLAFSMQFRAADKTLADEEVDTVYRKIIKNLEQTYKARLRE
ncbi:MAG: phenylalanine--tRNA ligase subunit beta [candidate division Zixibacteria bacterium]|nr:phenylalanine--tRNA ligase subunit beta [candidate division Zixibacteria bacterium]